MDNNFSTQVKEIISYSREEALRLGNDFIGAEHLMLGLIRDQENTAIKVLKQLNVNLAELRKEIEFSDYNDVEKWYKAHGTKGMKESGDSIVKTMKSIRGNKWEWTPSEKHAEMSIVMQWSYGCLRKNWKYKNLNVAGE